MMTDSLYSGGTTQPYSYPNRRSLDFSYGNTQALDQEFTLQQQIEAAQLLSPTQYQHQHQRHDSGCGMSPSSTPKTNVSPQQYQAKPQPYASTTQPPIQHGFPHRPVSMSRNGSHISTSSGQRHYGHQHRPSVDSIPRTTASDMTRTSTQLSNSSAGYSYQAENQPRDSQSMSNQDYASTVMTRNPSTSFASHTSYDQPGTSTSHPMNNFDMTNVWGTSVDISSIGQLFGQETNNTE